MSNTWTLIRAQVQTSLATAGVAATAQYYGEAPLDNYPTTAAVLRNESNPIVERGNNIVTRAYRIEVELRIRSTDPTGKQHFTDMEVLERALVTQFSEFGPSDFATITGLQIVQVEPKSMDGTGTGKGAYTNEARSAFDLVFYVNEAR